MAARRRRADPAALPRGRQSGPHAQEELAACVRQLPLDRQSLVLRAFSLYFQLANLAEQHHRVRRRREYEHEGTIPRESLEDAVVGCARAA